MSIGKTVGIVMFAGAVAAIWLWPAAKAPSVPEEIVRPVRSCVVTGDSVMPELRFAGQIKATESRTLRFKQAGRVERIPVSKGQKVKKGDRLAWLFADDFKNRVEEMTAVAERDRLSYQRISDAAKKNAVSREELSRAEAQLRQSEANLELAKRALEETVLTAPFDGSIADIPATELDMVSSADRIVVLQDLSRIKIDAVIPETIAILQRKIRHNDASDTNRCVITVTFDSFPGRVFDASFVECTVVADKDTQTFTATYRMDPVDDLLLLPGMSATVVIPAGTYRIDTASDGAPSVDIPESAVGVDGQGGYFAWRLDPDAEAGVYVAHRVALGGCLLKGSRMSVTSGVKSGDRVATAGVAVLSEGRRVTLLND